MMIATGLGISEFYVIPPAMAIFIIGTVIRIRVEEKILSEPFGKDYDDYRKMVLAIFPRFTMSQYEPG